MTTKAQEILNKAGSFSKVGCKTAMLLAESTENKDYNIVKCMFDDGSAAVVNLDEWHLVLADTPDASAQGLTGEQASVIVHLAQLAQNLRGNVRRVDAQLESLKRDLDRVEELSLQAIEVVQAVMK